MDKGQDLDGDEQTTGDRYKWIAFNIPYSGNTELFGSTTVIDLTDKLGGILNSTARGHLFDKNNSDIIGWVRTTFKTKTVTGSLQHSFNNTDLVAVMVQRTKFIL